MNNEVDHKAAAEPPLDCQVMPTHWMDDAGNVVTDEWLRGPMSSSDWLAAYTIPCRKLRGRIAPISGYNA